MRTADELYKLVDEASRLGAEYAEARYHERRRTSLFFLNGSLVGASTPLSVGVAIRVIYNGAMGFASTSDLRVNSLRDAVTRAVNAAKSSATFMKKRISMGQAFLGNARYAVEEQIPLEDLSVEDKISHLLDRLKSINMQKEGMKIGSYAVSYNELVERKVVVTSDGASVESRIPRVSIFYNISASSGDRRANRFNTVGASGGLEVIDDVRFESEIEEDVQSLYVNLVKSKSPPSGKMDVILGPEIVGLAMHESVGHPSEADRVLGREAAQAGLSYRRDYKESRIGSELVTVHDDPTIPKSYGFYLYDDEGVAARRRTLIKEGLLWELLHNRETATAYGTESNASARALDHTSEPIVRMANTYMAPGDYSFDEMIEAVKEGIYIKKYMEWNIDDYRWGARYVGLEAYLIRDGRLADPVRDVVLEINTKEFFSSVSAVGKDLQFFAGTCGKGEPSQPMPVWMGGPHVLLKGVRVG